MFRIGGSAGTGITTGLNKPRTNYQLGGGADMSKVPATNQNNNNFNLDLLSLLFPTEKKEDKFVPSEEL